MSPRDFDFTGGFRWSFRASDTFTTASFGTFGRQEFEDLLRGTQQGQHFRPAKRYSNPHAIACQEMRGGWLLRDMHTGKTVTKISDSAARGMAPRQRDQLKHLADELGSRYPGWIDLLKFVEQKNR